MHLLLQLVTMLELHIAATVLSALGGKSTAAVTVSNAVNITGTIAEVTDAMSVSDTKVVAATALVAVSDATSVAEANVIDALTNGIITATLDAVLRQLTHH